MIFPMDNMADNLRALKELREADNTVYTVGCPYCTETANEVADLKAKCDAMERALNGLIASAMAAQKKTHEQWTSNILYDGIVKAQAFAAMESGQPTGD